MIISKREDLRRPNCGGSRQAWSPPSRWWWWRTVWSRTPCTWWSWAVPRSARGEGRTGVSQVLERWEKLSDQPICSQVSIRKKFDLPRKNEKKWWPSVSSVQSNAMRDDCLRQYIKVPERLISTLSFKTYFGRKWSLGQVSTKATKW